MNDVSATTRAEVIRRAGNRCEYCQLSQLGQEAAFHIDHVVPRVAEGPTILSNLALACVSCSLRKSARQSAIGSFSGQEVPLFNPRTERWSDHFRWKDTVLEALTPIGRATVGALALNRELIVAIREEEMERRRHPPK